MNGDMVFILILVGMALISACVVHWNETREKIARIMREELNDDDQSDPEDSGEVRH